MLDIFPTDGVGYIALPRKITNYLTEGLPAKIYLLCYLQPQSGYGLAKSIYNNKITTAKIYGWTKKLVQADYLSYDRKKQRYSAKSTPLVYALKNILESKGLGMDNAEYRDLISLLESDKFKAVVQKHWEREKARETSILELVCETVSSLAAAVYFLKTIWQIPDLPRNERKRVREFIETNDEILPSPIYAEALSVMNAINGEIIKAELASSNDFPNSDASVFTDLVHAGAYQFVLAPKSFLEILSQLTPAGALIVDISKIAKAIPGIIEVSKKLNESADPRKGAEK